MPAGPCPGRSCPGKGDELREGTFPAPSFNFGARESEVPGLPGVLFALLADLGELLFRSVVLGEVKSGMGSSFIGSFVEASLDSSSFGAGTPLFKFDSSDGFGSEDRSAGEAESLRCGVSLRGCVRFGTFALGGVRFDDEPDRGCESVGGLVNGLAGGGLGRELDEPGLGLPGFELLGFELPGGKLPGVGLEFGLLF